MTGPVEELVHQHHPRAVLPRRLEPLRKPLPLSVEVKEREQRALHAGAGGLLDHEVHEPPSIVDYVLRVVPAPGFSLFCFHEANPIALSLVSPEFGPGLKEGGYSANIAGRIHAPRPGRRIETLLVYGISMIRNEADLVRLNMLYNSAVGIEHRLIVDNGSTDGTDRALKKLSRQDPRVRWTRDEGPYRQGEIHTELAREAYKEGADWVVQIDADEFWFVPKGDLMSILARSSAGVLRAKVLNYIQRRGQKESSPDALLHMTRRAAEPVGKGAQDLVEAGRLGFVEKLYPRKCLSRPTAEIRIEAGNHKVYDAGGPSENTNEIFCLHAPIRSRSALEERVRTAARPAAAGRKPGQGRYRRMLGSLQDDSAIEQEWAANSYEGDFLDVYGEKHPVLFDPRLRDAVAPFLPQPLWRKVYHRFRHLVD